MIGTFYCVLIHMYLQLSIWVLLDRSKSAWHIGVSMLYVNWHEKTTIHKYSLMYSSIFI